MTSLPGLSDVVAASQVIVSLVPPNAAIDVSRSVLACHPSNTIYVDANSCSVEHIHEMRKSFEDSGLSFVDGSIHGGAHRIREIGCLYLSGHGAALVEPIFSPFMRVRNLGEMCGAATSMKTLLGGISKGLCALFLESGVIASKAGLLPAVLSECRAFYPGVMEALERMLPTYPEHSARRVSEMHNQQQLANCFGLSARMSTEALHWIAQAAQLDWPSQDYDTRDVIELFANSFPKNTTH